jgi:anaerobic magnesium-protoporphyrin IX monomethyl ester cyclase
MRDSNILLINPPYPFYWETDTVDHLGLGYIASYVRSKGYKNVEVFNFNRTPLATLIPKLASFKPKYVGISVPYTTAYANALKVAKLVKESNPNTVVVMGGVHPSANPMEVIDNEYVNYVVKGWGELAFYSILEGETTTVIDFPVEDLDSLPFPDRPIFNRNHIAVMTSRGCPFECSFCCVNALYNKRWKARSPENVIKEIKQLNVNYISFDDDNLTLHRDRAEKLFLLLKKECNVKWNTPNGVYMNTLDYDLLRVMKSSGCYALVLPIESGDDFIRNKVMGKNSKKEKIREVVKSCKELGILTLGCFVIGMPGETMDSMNNSLEFAKELLPDSINVACATPYPGSPLYKQCVDNNYLKTTDYSSFCALESCIIETPYLRAEEVTKFRDKFVREFRLYHNEHNSIRTEEKQMWVRRPTTFREEKEIRA